MWYSVCECVCGGWFLCSVVQANEAITMLVSQPLPAGETGQVKRERERGGVRKMGRGGRDLKAQVFLLRR